MILGSGLLQSTGPSFGTVTADSSDSALLAGQDTLVCVYDGAAYIYFGKASGIWKTLWVDTTGGLLRGDTGGTYAVTLASDGPAPFDAAYGFATDRKAGSVAAGTAFTHTADCLVQYKIVTLPSNLVRVLIRISQESPKNYWETQARIAETLHLIEWVGDAYTARATSTAIAQNGETVTLVADSTTIAAYSGTDLGWSYASASSFVSATSGKLSEYVGTGGDVSDLVAWPRYASAVADILNKVSA